ncbi:acylneuraminate cytidylyltransferase family protein [Modestobacter sp. VKM Ac-2986]|uniref:acylneuraminate cytidylyltransferase family protein n=1 Tax=Modestobacter sp. VKM Ac-2986 TaxID=3004140 RepID=UPI0022AB8C27|nr:acylneuraminate cytidylyltransferase family protein [Modestobacter sp. VKM Ac-2986]MCZ2829759.1 acylneuraminate cytidylyltransferase family protein [Modestobacter sp. VKM Ac-2986]
MTRILGAPGVVAIVPARAGSRGLPGKNLATVGGTSLVGRAVRAARAAGVQTVAVSTDGAEIAAEATRLDATVVHRPPALAADDSRTVDALLHVADTLALDPDTLLVLLQPTSPLRGPEDVAAVLERHAVGDVRTTLTACRAEHHPYKELVLNSSGRAVPVHDWSALEAPRQQLPPAYRINGAVYAVAVGDLRRAGAVVVPDVAVVEMPEHRSIDIDGAADLARARELADG